MYSHVAVVAGVKKYRVPKIKCPGAVLNDTVSISAFCQGHDLLRVCLWKGGLSVIMVMENCQCSYTGLFDQLPGEIRTGSRAVASLTVPGGQEFLFPHFSQMLIIFSYFSSNVYNFLPHFGSPGGRVAHPGRPLTTPLTGRVISKPRPPPYFH